MYKLMQIYTKAKLLVHSAGAKTCQSRPVRRQKDS